MVALITGASSGIGRDFARELANIGFDLILVARRKERLIELQNELPVSVTIIPMDLSKPENCFSLHKQLKGIDIDVLINNAGFGLFGEFVDTDLDTELNMISLNITATHILTKLFIRDFVKRDRGFLLNVSSSAAFPAGGPLMATYYATKSYVYKLTEGIYQELREKGSNVSVSVLCPGPVRTEFNRRADVEFAVGSLSSQEVARYAVKKMFNKTRVITPGLTIKLTHELVRFVPETLALRVAYHIQHRKGAKNKR